MSNVFNLNDFRKKEVTEENYEPTPPLEDLSSVPSVVWALKETKKLIALHAKDKEASYKAMLKLLEVGDPDLMDPSDCQYFFRKIVILNDVMYDPEFWALDYETYEPWLADEVRDNLWGNAWLAKTNAFMHVLDKFNKEDLPEVEYHIACYVQLKAEE